MKTNTPANNVTPKKWILWRKMIILRAGADNPRAKGSLSMPGARMPALQRERRGGVLVLSPQEHPGQAPLLKAERAQLIRAMTAITTIKPTIIFSINPSLKT
jgi:hypothetical protein